MNEFENTELTIACNNCSAYIGNKCTKGFYSPKIYCIETELKTDGSFLQRSVLKYEKNFDDIIVGWRIDSKWRDGTNGEWESENNPLLKHNVNFTFTSQRFRGERFGIQIYLMKFPE